MNKITESRVEDPNTGVVMLFSFQPIEAGTTKSLGDMRVAGSVMGALNLPVYDGKFVVVKEKDRWDAPIIEPSTVTTIQESIDAGMSWKIAATGSTEIIGWLTLGYESQGQRTVMGKTVVTVFKVDEMGAFKPSPSCDERSSVTLEDAKQMFEDSPIDFGQENVMFDIFQAALNS